jgi:Peptidase family M1 domain
MRAFRVILVLALVPVLTAGGAARQDASARSPRNASYTLQATLDPASRTITGSGRLTWRNIARQSATELRFHLYWNAWRDASSSWMREAVLAGNDSVATRPADDRSAIDLSKIAIAGGEDLLPRAQFIAPDDGNTDDRTVLSVPLDRPVGPGETIAIDFAWKARVPRTFSRTGAIGSYFFIAQWFPKIGVLDDSGWNCHQFHAATEFFADFGTYDVSLTVPSGWTVGATGREQSKTDLGNGSTTHRYVEDDVHDFAWTTSPDFVERRDRFAEAGLPPVDIRLLLQPEHADQALRHLAATRAALKYYGAWFGPYPYGHVTVVDPVSIFNARAQGEGTGGMEYPTLFTAGTRWLAPWTGTQPESVTVHEAGHQFWYGVVATNEFEHAWMDEGLNTYSQARVLAEAFPSRFVAIERYFGGLLPWPFADVRWTREIDGNRLNGFRPVASYEVQSLPSWQYWPGAAGATSYNKTALWLTTLERLLGWPTVQKILSTYFERGAFRHPTPDEFFKIASEVSGRDLTWFFDAVHRGSASFDYGVDAVRSAPGDSTVVVRRFGDGVFPVVTRVTFEDGTTDDQTWEGRERWRAFRFMKSARVRTVEVDPGGILQLDLNRTNNSWTSQPRAAEAAKKWALRWLTWLQDLFLTYAFFA